MRPVPIWRAMAMEIVRHGTCEFTSNLGERYPVKAYCDGGYWYVSTHRRGAVEYRVGRVRQADGFAGRFIRVPNDLTSRRVDRVTFSKEVDRPIRVCR